MYIYDKSKTYTEEEKQFIKKLVKLDKYYSSKKLGAVTENGKTYFRIFASQADNVILVTFLNLEDENPKEFEMERDGDGVWEISIDGEHYGLYYGFKVIKENDENSKDRICLDPYAKAVTTFNTYGNPRRGIVVKENNYNWEGDEWIRNDWRDLIIYEMHVRDMTAHSSSGSGNPGTYRGLIEKNIKGGIEYIKSLGVNAVELLPCHEFANIEIPFNKKFMNHLNKWNPYERNHWGYMTASYFAPESYYSEDWKKLEWNLWMGKDGNQINQFKEVVKEFHKEGIAVLMDVVYNHISEYETGNLKEIDKEYYLRHDHKGNLTSQSGCGNDLKTERPMVRRMIVDSILYWMKEYHIDGFRFDIGKLIDWETVEEVIREAQKINPDVVFVCEPWGGGYDPQGFSLRGWGSWNDQIRNGVKGENPHHGQGWIFGKWYGNNNPERIKSYINGTLLKDSLGLFLQPEHSVNYLESHDGYTFGDFIRIGSGEVNSRKIIKNIDEHTRLTPYQLKLNKLSALFLFTSRGILMIHAGQEFARSKVIPHDLDVSDSHKGKMDHNSYEKDNETNYINFNHADINKELVDYYKGLIELRKTYSAFRRGEFEEVEFLKINKNEFAVAFRIKHKAEDFIVVMNANPEKDETINLPDGKWKIIVDEKTAGIKTLNKVSGNVKVPSSTGIILMK